MKDYSDYRCPACRGIADPNDLGGIVCTCDEDVEEMKEREESLFDHCADLVRLQGITNINQLPL